MAGLIKKQILKHLSRFAKNLSPDKINLSTLKGEGQLTNLELDEEVLQSLLDLPTWLAINHVGCNKAAIRIPWTKLKTHPISLTLDKVVMEMSTCDEPRPPNGPSPIATASGQSEYGFAEKVVEGISLSINSIVIRISAKAFSASFELSQLQVYSVNPSWSIGDLRFTRIQDPQRGELLSFKEISWQMIRIEADAIQSAEHEMISAPIRLITNQSKIRVTLKRRIKDCNVVASKLILILDDLLWVLTDSQLKAMVQYAKSLSDAMEKSAQQRKSMVSSSTTQSTQQLRTQQASTAADQSATMAKLFNDYDVWETSHHLQIKHLDLHICDDIHAKDKTINERVTGGAMQLSFSFITLDYYPLHKAGGSCLHWMHYGEATKARESWARRLLEEFRSNVEVLKNTVRDQQSSTTIHSKINTSSSFSPPPPQTPKSQLMSSALVLRMADFSIYQVSTADQRRSSPKAMISCNKKSLYLPPEMPAIHVEFTEYYFPDGKDYPIPCPNLFAQLNALQLVLDPRSLVWLNLFALDLRQSLEQFMEIYKLNDSQKPDEHVDVKIDGLMLKLVIPTDKDSSCPADLPHSISVQTSEMVATNTRHPANCTRSCLEALLQAFQEQDFFSSSDVTFPRSSSSLPLLNPVFHCHAHEKDTRRQEIYKGLAVPTMSTDSLKMPAASDFWALHFAQFWVDYEGRGRPQPFVDSFPLTVWACQPAKLLQHKHTRNHTPESGMSRSTSADGVGRLQRKRLLKEYYSIDGAPPPSPSNNASQPPTNGLHKPLSLDSPSTASSTKDANVHILVHVHKPLSAQVSHRQYMFLMQLQRSIKALKQTLQQDLEEMSSKKDRKDSSPAPDQEPFTACLGLLLQSAEVSLLLKPVPQPEGSPLTSELSPSESRGTLDPPREPADGADRVSEEASGRPESGAAQGPCTVDQLLCGEILEDEVSQGRTPLVPAPSTACSGSYRKVSIDEMTSVKNSGKWSSEEEKLMDGLGGVSELSKSQNCDPLCDPLSGTDSNDKDKNASVKMAQSFSFAYTYKFTLLGIFYFGRLMRDRSQSNFSVTYKNMKKSPSLQSLDNISIDSCMEDGDPYNLLEKDDVSISGFKDVMSEQCAAESAMDNATGAMTSRVQDGGVSPDTVSATSQSIDEPNKDTVSVLMLKVQSVCVGMEAVGENTAAALEVGRVTSSQLGNVSLRQYLSNRSLAGGEVLSGSRDFHGPEVCARLESGPSAAVHSELAKSNGFLTLHLHGYQASFLMSTLRNMAHFLEDYSAPQVLPMEISVMDTHIDLKDDDPSDGPPNIEPSPIILHVNGLIVHRKDDGSFTIGERRLTDTCLTPVPEAVGNICGISKTTQTSAPPSSPQPSSKEKMLMEENECLKVELSRAKMALAEAQMEKDSLLHRLKSLKVSPS
uniref:UHRF1 binding protein 1-like n=1 Tax=Neogobius melanostomus TaxID=47308 RepID=A0A8C6UHU3_9GOBI